MHAPQTGDAEIGPSGIDEASRPSPPTPHRRVVSVDVLRGVAIASMVVVNFGAAGPGAYYRQLIHSPWNGLRFADTVYPAFLFIVGTSMCFSLNRYVEGHEPRRLALPRIGKRVLLLFALGLVVNGFPLLLSSPGAVFTDIRIPGVLQRIAIAYLVAALVVLYLRPRYQVVLVLCLLLGYWALLCWVPVPGYGAGALTPHGNVAAWIDRTIFGQAHMYVSGQLGYDPEGLLGSIVAVSGVLFGYWTGMLLRSRSRRASLAMAATSVVAVGVGLLWSLVLPINKNMWTPSYVLVTTGLTLAVMSVCHFLFDSDRAVSRRIALPLLVLGSNAIVLYVGTELTGATLGTYHHAMGSLKDLPIQVWLWYRFLEPTFGKDGGSLVFALAVLAAWWLVAAAMYRLRWIIRV